MKSEGWAALSAAMMTSNSAHGAYRNVFSVMESMALGDTRTS